MGVQHVFRCTLPDDPESAAKGEILISHWLAEHEFVGDEKEITKGGSTTLVSGTKAILFSALSLDDEADTSYQIGLSADEDVNLYWASKATTGFTINSSYSGSTANVDWWIMR